jgi:hypothetical protein
MAENDRETAIGVACDVAGSRSRLQIAGCNDIGGSHGHVMTLEFSFRSMHGDVDLSIAGYWLQAACNKVLNSV